ncbi:hypothetical protein BGW36DRAFT_422503 [Talaromyces proteolyticus]|uniref:Zn(2)-C6 fungal-type domain-containing protein n=1 Tax=Talaromyces proteolyticus TaxID=1131652 RepID=A0AAD4L1T1_9EURO|nr:uncharacterized protein BGW36DRAFT_422503 [Talaromyces proteolyticus]KAH8705978.1 hypothetical protein BGW36DRAFT_422503 [Talaromyces proteolyticus]
MVNTGRPSRGCETCRRRRVKCDQRRPGCYRCEKIRQSCSGYRNLEQADSIFRVQTQFSYGPRSWQKPSARHRSRAAKLPCVPAEDSPTLAVYTPGESWDLHVIPLILSQFSSVAPGGGVSRVYSSLESAFNPLHTMESGSLLDLASHAVGSAYLANKTRSPNFKATHQRLYGKALRVLHVVLQDPKLQKQDSTLLAVWLLCLYELMTGSSISDELGPGPLSWDIHSRALESFLKLRGCDQFSSKTGCQLFQLIYHTIQIRSMQTGCQPPPEAFQWFDSVKSSGYLSDTIFVPLFSDCDKAARICSNIQYLIHQFSLQGVSEFVPSIFATCSDLEASMKDHFKKAIEYSSTVMTPESMEQALRVIAGLQIRNHIDACFLRLDQCLLNLLHHASKQSQQAVGQLEELEHLRKLTIFKSQNRAERILEAVPRLLPVSHSCRMGGIGNWANALRLIWPLRLISSFPVLLDSQQSAASSALARIAYDVGIMQAVGKYLVAYEDFINITQPTPSSYDASFPRLPQVEQSSKYIPVTNDVPQLQF